jgi:hypothetical protein
MSDNRSLPQQFSALQPFVADWAIAGEGDRLIKLLRTSIPELKVFYDAVYPRAEEMRIYLSQFKLDAMPEDAQTLFDLLLTFVETAHPIELNWKDTDIDDVFAIERMTIDPFKAYPPNSA